MASFLYVGVYVGSVFVFTFILTKWCKRRRQQHYEVRVRDVSKGHRWCMTEMFDKPTYCNISGEPVIHGAFCDSCGICVQDSNIKQANKTLLCKQLSTKGPLRHHWIEGNLPLYSRCYVCQERCGILPQLSDFRCCWCMRTVHTNCKAQIDNNCDLGRFSNFIVPPNRVQLKLVGWKGRRHWIVGSVSHPETEDWKPLVVFGNRKSGNNDGEHLLQMFRGLLNPAQVIDLANLPPESGLEWCHLVPNVSCKLVVCGGDGTVSWVLSAIDKMKLPKPPALSILPLGTGNDLSRALGWGPGYTADIDITKVLEQVKRAELRKFDRWNVEIARPKRFGLKGSKKDIVMNAYVSVGVDAQVALNFHRHRESRPLLFGSRLLNKFWYFTYGSKDVLERQCKDLHEKIQVELDDVAISLPSLEGIVVLNINSWCAGLQPWTLGGGDQGMESRTDDGLLEVMGLYSSFHIAQFQVGLAEPLRLGQAKKVKIILFGGKAPMQIDGEPWDQSPATITITHHNQVPVLVNTSTHEG